MIRVYDVADISAKQTCLSSFKVNRDILLVPSLHDKLFWREYFLADTEILTDESVQRMSDFLVSCLRYLGQPYKLVSKIFFITYLEENLDKFAGLNTTWDASSLYSILVEFQDIVFSDEMSEVFNEWLEQKQLNREKWAEALPILEQLKQDLEVRQWITKDLLPSLLLKHRHDVVKQIHDKNIFVSLDFSFSSLEAKFLYELSHDNTIHVLIPEIEPIETFLWDYQVYKPFCFDTAVLNQSKILNSLHQKMSGQKKDPIIPSAINYYEFNTAVEEVQFTIETIKDLLKQGIRSSDIAVLAIQKDKYANLFDLLLQREGLHSQSTQDSSVVGLKQIQSLIAKLNVKLQELETEDLEASVFATNESLKYNSFFRNFTNVYDVEEVSRKLSFDSEKPDETCDKHHFMQWLFEEDIDLDINPFVGILNDVPAKMYLKKRSWLTYLKQSLAEKYLRKSSIHDNVLQVLSLSEASLQQGKQVFILGANDKDLREAQNYFFDTSHIESLAYDLGIVVSSQISQKKFVTLLKLFNEKNHFYLSYSTSDVKGNLQEPSIFHFKLTPQKPRVEVLALPDSTENKNAGQEGEAYLPQRLSASHIESYLKCPFIYYARHVLKLEDVPALDIDIDPLSDGSILHECLADLVSLAAWPHVSTKDLEACLRTTIEKNKDNIKEISIINSYTAKTLQYLNLFQDFEKNWRQQFPQTKTWATEKTFNVYLNKDGFFTQRNADDSIAFMAKVDRIDIDDQNRVVVIDYKTKLSSEKHVNCLNGLGKGQIQLGLYALLLEDLRQEFSLEEVLGAIYFTLKPLQREKGFLLKQRTSLYVEQARKQVYIDTVTKQKFYNDLRQTLKQTIDNIRAGKFEAKPLDKKNCPTCKWRDACKAKHLS